MEPQHAAAVFTARPQNRYLFIAQVGISIEHPGLDARRPLCVRVCFGHQRCEPGILYRLGFDDCFRRSGFDGGRCRVEIPQGKVIHPNDPAFAALLLLVQVYHHAVEILRRGGCLGNELMGHILPFSIDLHIEKKIFAIMVRVVFHIAGNHVSERSVRRDARDDLVPDRHSVFLAAFKPKHPGANKVTAGKLLGGVNLK